MRSRKGVISILILLGKLNLLVLTGKHRGAKGTLNTNETKWARGARLIPKRN